MSGSCGMCRVTIASGADQLAPLGPAERHHCKGATGKDGEPRLACQAVIQGDGGIRVTF
jgi:ferredoxin